MGVTPHLGHLGRLHVLEVDRSDSRETTSSPRSGRVPLSCMTNRMQSVSAAAVAACRNGIRLRCRLDGSPEPSGDSPRVVPVAAEPWPPPREQNESVHVDQERIPPAPPRLPFDTRGRRS